MQRGVSGLVAQYIHELADGRRSNGHRRSALADRAEVGDTTLRVRRPEACTA
jgi:hypothetical protein